jgi:hypothetical protein
MRGLDPRIHAVIGAARVGGETWMAGSSPRRPVQTLRQLQDSDPECEDNQKQPLPGFAPGIHVLETGPTEAGEGVDGRVEPGHGDLRVRHTLSCNHFS